MLSAKSTREMKLFGNTPPRKTADEFSGTYLAHRDGRRYAYHVMWTTLDARIKWQASVSDNHGRTIGHASGEIDLKRLNSTDEGCWVQAAVELAIERDQILAQRRPITLAHSRQSQQSPGGASFW